MANVLADREAWTVQQKCVHVRVENRGRITPHFQLIVVTKQAHLLGWGSEARDHRL